jgi:fructosamine-3-kinase
VKAALREALAARLGSPIVRSSAASGGEINQAFRIELADGRHLFVKTHAAAPPGMYECEARGLAWLRQAGALRVPEVAYAGDLGSAGACLAIEHLAPGNARAHPKDFDAALGAGLAALHRAGADQFGLSYDNFIALLPQANASLPTFGEFYAARRLAPQLERAQRSGHIGASLAARVNRLIERIDELIGPPEPPARLHGDLWNGNVISDEHGAPCLIDPAVYAGHREIDLAMMRLFGGFSERVFEAYAAAFPLAAGQRERVPLFQLYPVLVHVNLFGAGYVRQVESLVAHYR